MVTFKGKTIAQCLDIAKSAGVSKPPKIAKRINGVATASFDVSWSQLRRQR